MSIFFLHQIGSKKAARLLPHSFLNLLLFHPHNFFYGLLVFVFENYTSVLIQDIQHDVSHDTAADNFPCPDRQHVKWNRHIVSRPLP